MHYSKTSTLQISFLIAILSGAIMDQVECIHESHVVSFKCKADAPEAFCATLTHKPEGECRMQHIPSYPQGNTYGCDSDSQPKCCRTDTATRVERDAGVMQGSVIKYLCPPITK
ncbi:hypothetical protein Pst134EA_019522 [Puccinia striiformis f. sp. tritici]|uniref:hypothetical protein n=1 Tax=Puccinia striiformis f. sp. tritici TaxID=168172 RepID=UPI002008AC9F|nr:hypothetical protein Pst134EA_019522 [Puccinia striiformis f. sp. tritici]KAH9459370.1 hypothetical protein Pst134EA_019522 [Puccinia striiformis f. sp. tritici]KAI9618752.1 hypothetical protein KEM48_006517 [Puccinia striiformis f. sp. tritici PST-130]